jgi:hypothetical protein
MTTEQETLAQAAGQKALYAMAASAGLWIIPREKCRQLLALLHAFGGGDSQWTITGLAFKCLFAAQMLKVEGGETPDAEDITEIRRLLQEVMPNGLLGKPADPLPAWAEHLLRENRVRLPR